MIQVSARELQIGDDVIWHEKTRTIVNPKPEVRHIMGRKGERIPIVRHFKPVENCVTDFSMVHISTDKGIVCVHQDAEFTVVNR